MGVWKRFSESSLVLPLDVHVFRLCRRLGLTARKTPSMKAAMEITGAFSTLFPEDPAKLDFLLSAWGTDRCGGGDGPCTGHRRAGCPLAEHCRDLANTFNGTESAGATHD